MRVSTKNDQSGQSKNGAFKNSILSAVMLIAVLLSSMFGWSQTSVQNFGTGSATQTSQTASTSFIPAPTAGTTYSRAGATAPNAPINIVNTTNLLGSTGSYVRAVASATGSVCKVSPWINYGASTEFYTSFKVMLGDAAAGSTATAGTWSFYQGAGAMYSDANDFSGAQVFTGLRFTFAAGGAINLTYRSGAAFTNASLTQSAFSSGTVYNVEIVGNNKASGTINYIYNGNAQSVAVQKFDLYINGTKIGDDLTPGILTAGANIASGTFIGINSAGNVANIFLDDATVYNAVPASIGASAPTVTTTTTSSITTTGASSGGDVTADGGAAVTARGVAYGITANPTTAGTVTTDGSGTGVFVSTLSGLSVNTQYFYRAYATNSATTGYGAESSFYTLANTPSAPTTGGATSSSLNVSIGGGDGNPATTQYAIRETASGDYVQADGSRAATEVWQTAATWASVTVTGLTASTLYNFDVKARNGANVETGFGSTGSGTTSAAGAQNQTITFNALANVTYGDAPFALTATASSGLTVTYESSNTNVATVSGNTVTIVGAGSTNITASQAGDINWNPAPDVIQSLTVDPKELTVTGAVAQNKTYDGNTNAAIDLTGATLNGVVSPDNVTFSGAGTFATANAGTAIAVTANLSLGGSDAGNYFLTQPSGLSADINQAPQTITFNPLPSKTTADAPFALTATASSGLTVSYNSSNPLVATIAGNIVTIVGAGSTTITASQAGDGNYEAAASVDQVQVVTVAPTVVKYSFGASPGTAAPTSGTPVTNLAFSDFSQGNNNGTTTMLSGTSASSGYTGSTGTFNAAAAAVTGEMNSSTSTYFEFTLTPAPANKVTLSTLTFGSRSTSTGPQAYSVRSSLDGYTDDIATGTTPNNSSWGLRSPAVTATESGFGQPITFRIYGHSGTGNAALGTANWRVDDVSVGVFVEAAPACVGTPDAGTISGGGTYCGTGSETLTLSGNTDINSASGLSIQWFSSTDNITFNPIGVGNETSWPTGTLTDTTYYYAVITCSNSGFSATTNTVTVTVNPIPDAPTVSLTQPGCASPTGAIDVTAPLGLGYTYSIGGAYQPETNFPSLAEGSYNVTAQLNGCISPVTVAVINPQPIVPGTPGPVSGISNVCPYIGTATQLVYSIDPVAGATGYQWTVPPTVTLVSGQNTNSISVTINAGFIANANKLIRVRSTSVCGISQERLFYLLAQLPTTPAPIVASSTDLCGVIGTPTTITYRIPKVAAATSYIWTSQAGTTTVTHPEGPGVNDTLITVSFSSGFTTSAITVQAVNDCGLSGIRSFTVVRSNPSTPSLISGPTNACAHIAPGGTQAVYSVPAVAGVTYNWTVPGGVNDLTGQGTNSISFTYPSGFTTGTVSVSASNGCGLSGTRTLNITRLNPGTPGGIDVIQVAPCPSRQYSYTIAAIPANATSILWTVPVEGTIESGQGTTSIVVSYPGTAISGTVSATAVSNCGNSLARTVVVKLPVCEDAPPPPPFARVGSGNVDLNASVSVFPNPTNASFNLKVVTAGKEAIVARVLDLQGRAINRIIVQPHQQHNFGSDLKAGTYILEITQGCKKSTQKLIKL